MAITDEFTGTSVENRFWHIEEFHSSRYLVYDMGSNQVHQRSTARCTNQCTTGVFRAK